MANINLLIDAEFEQIDKLLRKLPSAEKLPFLSEIKLAGVATYLHNFYNGLENILKFCLRILDVSIGQSATWHKDLLDSACQHGIISIKTKTLLAEYLFFRHFFVNAYAFDLQAEKMENLVKNLSTTFKLFESEIQAFLKMAK